jgi:hypothetical protein
MKMRNVRARGWDFCFCLLPLVMHIATKTRPHCSYGLLSTMNAMTNRQAKKTGQAKKRISRRVARAEKSSLFSFIKYLNLYNTSG